jgi:hypothetical protein
MKTGAPARACKCVTISENHVKMDKVKVQGILDWPTPQKVKDVQAFLGFANFYQQFVKNFSEVARPLTQLTRKDLEWEWTKEAEEGFNDIKHCFTTAPILVMADSERPMKVETDASDCHALAVTGTWEIRC